MAQPFFEIRQIVKCHDVQVFSSNFALYGDLSARVMSVLDDMSPCTEIYSIDEAFLEVPSKDLAAFGQSVHTRVRRWVGIPTTAGMGATKTQAKLASWIAKRRGATYHIFSPEDLIQVPAAQVWGIGKASALKLKKHAMHTARCLCEARPETIRNLLGVVGMRTCLELKGEIAYPLEMSPELKQNIGVSRSFEKPLADGQALRAAATHFAERAGEKLRAQGSCASGMMVYARTNHFLPGSVSAHTHISLPAPTSQSSHLVRTANYGLDQILRPGLLYKKLGILLVGLAPQEQAGSLFELSSSKGEELQKIQDGINRRYGRQTLQLARGLNEEWMGGKHALSNRYTTSWDELCEVH